MIAGNVFLCNGQCNQDYRMGNILFPHNPLFIQWMERIDFLYKNITGNSFLAVLSDNMKNKSEIFNLLKNPHPTLFTVQYACGITLNHEGIVPKNQNSYFELDFLLKHPTFSGTISPELFVLSCLSGNANEIEYLLNTISIVDILLNNSIFFLNSANG